jgi:hypothetical protein
MGLRVEKGSRAGASGVAMDGGCRPSVTIGDARYTHEVPSVCNGLLRKGDHTAAREFELSGRDCIVGRIGSRNLALSEHGDTPQQTGNTARDSNRPQHEHHSKRLTWQQVEQVRRQVRVGSAAAAACGIWKLCYRSVACVTIDEHAGLAFEPDVREDRLRSRTSNRTA